jgi:hypothetical protein
LQGFRDRSAGGQLRPLSGACVRWTAKKPITGDRDRTATLKKDWARRAE